MGITMAVIVAAQVFSRYVLNYSLFWSEELARFLLVWLTFIGATVAYFYGAHPGVDALYRRLPPGLQRWARMVVHLSSLCLFSVMVIHGAWFAWFVRLQITPALSLPKWIIMGVVPMAGVIFLVHGLAFLSREIFGGSQKGGDDH
ncbi:MAG: TRAP transporter small permease [Desulfobacteraceae bacterium]|nr:TRAP transporter small permease [Desulfobacteraceae bacterium]